jgi:hypothetical protein
MSAFRPSASARAGAARASVFRPGDVIGFGLRGNARGLVTANLAFDDDGGFAWTTGRLAGIDIPIEPPALPLNLTLTMAPFLHGARVVSQEATIHVNGLLLGHCLASNVLETGIEVEPAVLQGGMARLRLLTPTAVRPRSVGAGSDERLLGFRLIQIGIG